MGSVLWREEAHNTRMPVFACVELTPSSALQPGKLEASHRMWLGGADTDPCVMRAGLRLRSVVQMSKATQASVL